jgi:hypothetical protein
MALAVGLAVLSLTAAAATLSIENSTLAVKYEESSATFSVTEKASGAVFLKNARLDGVAKLARAGRSQDSVFGAGQSIIFRRADGSDASLELYPSLPFVLVRGSVHNGGKEMVDLAKVVPASFTLDLGKPAAELRTMGTGGLTPPDQQPGSYLFLTLVTPATRRGVVAGWLTEDRGSGVFFANVNEGTVQFRAQIDYGHLRLLPGASARLETMAVGLFDDARIGQELYADAIKKQYAIKLRPQTAVYCSWYADKHGMAGDEKATLQLAKFAAKELKPFGFGVVQIDDGWQGGTWLNGPRRGFDRVRTDRYPHGLAPVAGEVEKLGLTFGLWWLPFGRNYQDPEYKDRQDWFAQREDGKPYDTSWGGTSLDLTHPDVRAHLAHLAKTIRSWGVKYYKMDGLFAGAVCEHLVTNDGYRDDHFGNNRPLHNPLKTNIEAYRDGLKLIRENAGDDVFFSGCCVSQNMRELCALGLVDSMRIGPDYNADGNGTKTGPIHGSRLYFLNGRVWWNDPDPCILRAAGESRKVKPVSLSQARLAASWVAIAGQFYLNSDWIPDLPAERLEVMKRTLSSHGATARPVDYFDNALPNTWLVTDTRQTVRRDVLGVFNQEKSELNVRYSCAKLGLEPSKTYYAFDFWDNAPARSFTGSFECVVPPSSCRIIAVRVAEDHPVLVSTSRHVTQGMVDVSGEKWNPSRRTLSGGSQVVGGDLYELRIAGLKGDHTQWQLAAVAVSDEDAAAGVTVTSKPAVATEDGWMRVLIRAPQSRQVRWTISFEASRPNSSSPAPPQKG